MRVARWCLLSLVLGGAGVFAQTPQAGQRPTAPAAGTARIRGQVVTADTGTAVRGARVDLASPGTGGWTVTTERDGRFEIARLPAGKFVLTVTKPGFVTTSFGQTPALQNGKNIDLQDGQLFDKADVRLPRGAVIAGRVIDDNGEPVVEADVTALQLEYVNGARQLRKRRAEQTNDLGEFRLYGLPPGKYYVSAAGARANQIAAVETGSGDAPRQFVAGAEGVAPTYYPGTARASEAQAIVVEAGAAAPPITIALLSVHLSRISGTIVHLSGAPGNDMIAMLNPVTSDGLPMAFNLVEADATGHFILPNIAPGSYRVDVVSKAMIENVPKTGSGGVLQNRVGDEFASVPVSVNGDDIDGLVVTTTTGFQLAGRIVVEGAAVTADMLAAMKVLVQPAIPGTSSSLLSARSDVGADATFVVRGLIGTRLIRSSGLPAGWVLKSVRVAGTDVTDAGLDFSHDIADTEIVVTAKPAQVSGVVTDERGAPLQDHSVAIFAEDRRLWTLPMTRYVTSARTDANGQFRIAALPAGAYLAVATDALPAGEWAEPEYLDKLRAKAIAFSLADGEAKTISLVFPPR